MDTLQTDSIIHFFGDTTLEFPETYEYVNGGFRRENPRVALLPTETENDFLNFVMYLDHQASMRGGVALSLRQVI